MSKGLNGAWKWEICVGGIDGFRCLTIVAVSVYLTWWFYLSLNREQVLVEDISSRGHWYCSERTLRENFLAIVSELEWPSSWEDMLGVFIVQERLYSDVWVDTVSWRRNSKSVTVRWRQLRRRVWIINQSVCIYPNCATNANYIVYTAGVLLLTSTAPSTPKPPAFCDTLCTRLATERHARHTRLFI